MPGLRGQSLYNRRTSQWHGHSQSSLVYQQRHLFSEIAPAQAAGSTSLQQQITIPAGTSHPTLSFLYRLETAEQGGSILKINTISDTASTTVYSTTQSTNGWTHQWLDLGDLAGQTITLTLELQQEIGTIPTQAFIDEVTVGNAYPDTWVAVTGGANYLPGEYAILTIPYGNRGEWMQAQA